MINYHIKNMFIFVDSEIQELELENHKITAKMKSLGK